MSMIKANVRQINHYSNKVNTKIKPMFRHQTQWPYISYARQRK